jgi:hypothetical protein
VPRFERVMNASMDVDARIEASSWRARQEWIVDFGIRNSEFGLRFEFVNPQAALRNP